MATTEVRDRITDRALELFNRDGIRAVTTERIAANLQISKRTLYEIFATKDELVLACLKRVYQYEGMKGDVPKDGKECFMKILGLVRSTVEMNIRYAKLASDAERYYPELNGQLIKSYGSRLRESLKSMLDVMRSEGRLRESVDIDTESEVICRSAMKCREYGEEACFTYLRGLLSIKAIREIEN